MKMLSLDGGGVFGQAQARILEIADCYDKFECFAGTSIGSAQVAAIALGIPDRVGSQFFNEWMHVIFNRSLMRKCMFLFVSKYSDNGLNEALQSIFDGALFGDVKKPLFITTSDIGRRTIRVFDSTNFDDARVPMWEVVRSATAAETFFDSWKGLADGGVFANNPSMVLAAAASRVLKIPLNEMEILSIGTGRSTVDGQKVPRSMIQWGEWLVRALLTGASDDMHDYFVRSLPLKKYIRVQFLRDGDWKMDNIYDMDKAMEDWEYDIKKAIKVVEDF